MTQVSGNALFHLKLGTTQKRLRGVKWIVRAPPGVSQSPPTPTVHPPAFLTELPITSDPRVGTASFPLPQRQALGSLT